MDKQQRSAHYFDLLWDKITNDCRMKFELKNFIESEREDISIEMIARLGHYAFGDKNDNDHLLASIMQKRIYELQSNETEKLAVRKANYFSMLIKDISKGFTEGMIKTGMVFLFEDSHTSITEYEFERLASFAYKEHTELSYQLFAILLKDRFIELIIKKKCEAPQETVASHSIPFLLTKLDDLDVSVRVYNCFNAAKQFPTAQEIYDTSANDLLKVRNFGKAQLREVTILFAQHGLLWPKNSQTKDPISLLQTPIAELPLSARLIGCLQAIEKVSTAQEIYDASAEELLKYRNLGEKKLEELKVLFAEHGLIWPKK